jgi:hypothetical protein
MTPTSIAPTALSVHPAVAKFPYLGEDEIAALTISIKQYGVLTPLICDEERRVYDGRARMAIAESLGLTAIPVIVREEKDPLAFAIESRVNRGQLTRSAIALVLFEQHPELATSKNRGGRPKKNCSSGEQLSATHDSYRQLGIRYRVPYQYFSALAEMHAGMSEEDWAHLRHVVLYEEASIPRQFTGFLSGQPAGSQRGAVIYAALIDGELKGILPKAFSSLRNGFENWNGVPTDAKAAIEREWEGLLEGAPAELLKIAVKKGGRRG